MIGHIGSTDRLTAPGNRGGVRVVLLALLLGGGLALASPPLLPMGDHTVLVDVANPWDGAKPPEPPAVNRVAGPPALLAPPGGKPRSSGSTATPQALAASLPHWPDGHHVAAFRRPRAAIPRPPVRWLADDPHGPPLATPRSGPAHRAGPPDFSSGNQRLVRDAAGSLSAPGIAA